MTYFLIGDFLRNHQIWMPLFYMGQIPRRLGDFPKFGEKKPGLWDLGKEGVGLAKQTY